MAGFIPKSAERVCGMHFFYPVPNMKLVEIATALQTSEETKDAVLELGKRMGKTPIVSQDSPSFINNRIFTQYLIGGVQVLGEGIASKEDIDRTMKLGCNWPMGPIELADFCGLDLMAENTEMLYEDYGDNKYKSHPILKQHVNAGFAGTKAGRGFYDWTQKK